jgi:hypothetical protein
MTRASLLDKPTVDAVLQRVTTKQENEETGRKQR